jgi:hypothetical protein
MVSDRVSNTRLESSSAAGLRAGLPSHVLSDIHHQIEVFLDLRTPVGEFYA